MAEADPLVALKTAFAVLYPQIPEKAHILFINAREDEFLNGIQPVYQQYFRPFARALEVRGRKVEPVLTTDKSSYDMILMLGPRQHEESLYAMAMGLTALKPDGFFLAAAANDAGGRRLADDLRSFGLEVHEDSKAKSRIVWAKYSGVPEQKFMQAALQGGDLRQMQGAPYWSQPGVFSWDRIDEGSAKLSQFLSSEKLKGKGSDFGCGYGYLSCQILHNHVDVAHMTALDADARAVECTKRTLAEFSGRSDVRWADAEQGENLPSLLDFIVMNPPFHKGGKALPEVGRAFVSQAAKSLRKNGILWMVANAHLPYEDVLNEEFARVEKMSEEGGYKIFRAEK